MIVRLLPDAEADLEAIGDYIARDNPNRARSFVAELREKCESLAAMPQAFPLVPCYKRRGLRYRAHGNYLIFYRATGEPIARIDVVHVIHGARNYAAILF
ncbi:Plasmid stabilization system protein [Candidatus Burkholderia verschuerenii]|uniref:Plasmid stabilization system protein n=1 Tax=Candidatus Burkholderia verschuerenii TaxID=242163 RepID=A0A0L0M3X2_9BURK|nr:type II toxin-antitoxin system RelE/ParE family toxin [Candidatus Burkholderia verschuerenii]KND57347.1 Plasmid stabilization system protein [Candidatus Burkholderia verschuerenii]